MTFWTLFDLVFCFLISEYRMTHRFCTGLHFEQVYLNLSLTYRNTGYLLLRMEPHARFNLANALHTGFLLMAGLAITNNLDYIIISNITRVLF